MHRDSGFVHAAARTVFAAVLALALGHAVNASAQRAEPAADEPAADAAPADQPRRGRDRRRGAAAAEQLPVFEAPTSAPPTDDSAGEVEARMVCKNIKLTGTKIARRICGTQEQWASMEKRTSEKAEEGMRQMRERSTIVTAQPQSPLGGGNAGLGGAN